MILIFKLVLCRIDPKPEPFPSADLYLKTIPEDKK
jgi:hypothetical protein